VASSIKKCMSTIQNTKPFLTLADEWPINYKVFRRLLKTYNIEVIEDYRETFFNSLLALGLQEETTNLYNCLQCWMILIT
jgi:hypothetical protein